MGKKPEVKNLLQVVDKEQYVLDGTLMKIEKRKGVHQKAKLDERSVRQTVAEYKHTKVDPGVAFGMLENQMIIDTKDEVSDAEMKNINDNFEIKIDQDFEDVELSMDEVAFQILDIMYDLPNRRIVGRIQLLDTPEGLKARKKIDEGLQCYISSSGVEDVVVRDKSVDPALNNNKWAFEHKLQAFKEGWKLSFIGRGGGFGF